jgi:hypothetical protein
MLESLANLGVRMLKLNNNMRKNPSGADNQQETHLTMGILRDYTPDTIFSSPKLAILLAFLYTDGGISKHRLKS